MNKILTSIVLVLISLQLFAQIDKEQFALDVSKADAANTEKLKGFIWKRHSAATVDGVEKATVINELSFGDDGKIQVTQIDANTTVKQKRGVRGAIQKNTAEDNMEYVEQALGLALAYTFMSKGQLLDYFEGSTITEKDGTYKVVGENVLQQGDKLTVVVEKATNLFLSKNFSTKLGEDPIDGELKFAKFSSGVGHGTTTVLNLPGKNAQINAKNQDYTARIQ